MCRYFIQANSCFCLLLKQTSVVQNKLLYQENKMNQLLYDSCRNKFPTCISSIVFAHTSQTFLRLFTVESFGRHFKQLDPEIKKKQPVNIVFIYTNLVSGFLCKIWRFTKDNYQYSLEFDVGMNETTNKERLRIKVKLQ